MGDGAQTREIPLTASIGTKSGVAPCRVCQENIALEDRPLIGEVVECSHCRAQLEVASIAPLVLELLAKVEVEEEDFEGF